MTRVLLFWTGIVFLTALFIWDVWAFRIGVFFYLRIWLLAVPLYFLHRKIKKGTGKGIADRVKAEVPTQQS